MKRRLGFVVGCAVSFPSSPSVFYGCIIFSVSSGAIHHGCFVPDPNGAEIGNSYIDFSVRIVLGSSWHFVIRSYCSSFLRRAALVSGRCSTWPSSPDMEAGHSDVLLTSPVQPQTASVLSSCVVISKLAFVFCPLWGKHLWSCEVSALRSGERQVLEGNVGSTAQSPPKYLISHGTG